MPEIKHQFTAGKMNKDLDERLVPNGEYRDAMNIQVSTSEDSNVGTVQNILGNSFVSGQSFIGPGAYCVGSVADEKNDKFYYLISHEYLLASGFGSPGNLPNNIVQKDGGGSVGGWSITDSTGWAITNGTANAISGENGRIQISVPEIQEGNYYTIHYDVTVASTGGQLILANHGVIGGLGGGASDNNVDLTSSNNDVGSYSLSWLQGSSNIETITIYCADAFDGSIDNVRVFSMAGDCIFEHDSKNNIITPVLIDTTKEALNFSKNRLITGINIIDDMLFWTDNNYEPKKINIPRSIEGTTSSGQYPTHTNFVNLKTTTTVPIEEEHVTVIKKQPKNAPVVKLNPQRDPDKTYSGVMRIIKKPNVPMVISGNNPNNTSSLRAGVWSDGADRRPSYHYDFSKMKVGTIFNTRIETDLNGESGFNLTGQWAIGSTVVFKEFSGETFEEAPTTPITDYTIKAVIQDWGGNHKFSDSPTEQISNGDFTEVNNAGTFALGWYGYLNDPSGNGTVLYDSVNAKIDIDAPQTTSNGNLNYRKVYEYSAQTGLVEDATYKLTFEISDYVEGEINCQLVVSDDFFNNNSVSDVWYYRGPGDGTGTASYYGANGVYTHEFVLNINSAYNASTGVYGTWSNFAEKVMFQTKGEFKGSIKNVSLERVVPDFSASAFDARVKLKIIDIKGVPPVVPTALQEIRYAVDLFDPQENLFEFKMPRIACRYRYQDGEYSAISPFSQVVFLPGSFDYHPIKGYNVGMTNRLKSIDVSGFMNNIPDGVVSIDLIYKEDSSPNLYIIDTITPSYKLANTKIPWDEGTYTMESETIKEAIESNQLLRPWDSVPRKALAQEITGNRIVYGNYTQGFDLKTFAGNEYNPSLEFQLSSIDEGLTSKPSVKSLREYQLGAVFVDKYGRETPVVSNNSVTRKIPKALSDKQNKFEVGFLDNFPPEKLEYVKFFIKETSGEYYNLAMDRFYESEDEQIWLSFPSSDRNKVEVDDFIILKKSLESDSLVEDTTKYKVLDIQNEAPDFIKQKKFLAEEIKHNLDATGGATVKDIFGTGIIDNPLQGVDRFTANYAPFANGSAGKIHQFGTDVYIEFVDVISGVVSKRYQASSISTNWGVTASFDATLGGGDPLYTFQLDKVLGDDVNFITDDSSGLNPSFIRNNIAIRIYKYIPKNSAQFDGRFFAKINSNTAVNENILSQSQLEVSSSIQYRTVASKKIYLMGADHEQSHRSELTGMIHGCYADKNKTLSNSSTTAICHVDEVNYFNEDSNQPDQSGENARTGFGPYACFFRNYDKKPGDYVMRRRGASGATAWKEVGQYAFGFGGKSSTKDSYHWSNELAWVTGGAYFNSNTDAGSGTQPNSSGEPVGVDEIPGSDSQSNANKLKLADNRIAKVSGTPDNRADLSVWHITRSPKRAYTNSLTKPDLKSNNFTRGYQEFQHGTHSHNSHSHWNLALGGVFNPEVTRHGDDNHTIDNFWKIGEDGGNSQYDVSKVRNLIKRLSGGTKFRFKEDFTKDIYTIKTISKQYGRTLWNSGVYSGNSSDSFVDYFYGYANNDGGYGAFIDPQSSANPGFGDHTNLQVAYQLSPNFLHQYYIDAINKDGGTSINWDPVGDGPGPITNGLELTLTASSNATKAGQNPRVYVSTLEATDANGDLQTVKEGMILTNINGSQTYSYVGDAPDATNGDKGELLVYRITYDSANAEFTLYLTGYRRPMVDADYSDQGLYKHHWYNNTLSASGDTMTFKQGKMNGYSQYSSNRINAQASKYMANSGVHDDTTPGVVNSGIPRIMPVSYTLEFVEEIEKEPGMPENPAVWETEPKEETPLDIYYEASGYNPIKLTDETKYLAIPIGSSISHNENPASVDSGVTVGSIAYDTGWYIVPSLSSGARNPLTGTGYIETDEKLDIKRPDGSVISVTVTAVGGVTNNRATKIYISDELYGPDTSYTLNWHNCFTFGNGVESNRVRDNFNQSYISNGVKASTTVSSSRGEEHRKYGLIYSGIYNGTSETNNLNQFIAAEKITKDVNPIYGSIQKLHSRDTDLVTICEDKTLKILANKDAVFNADGNPQLTANQNVLGQTIPFVGEYGISKNPESFASESYRAYFTDKVRGAVMRLSKDGLTPISEAGMKDYFKDNLKNNDFLIGSYDDKKDEYNLTMPTTAKTVSYKENVRGWVSFKSFVPENAISCANEYYTLKEGKLYKHHDEGVNRNTFYDQPLVNSSFEVVLNDFSGSIKTFNTLDYEGSQSKIEGIKRIEVTGVQHNLGISVDGRYAFFETQDMNRLLGRSDWNDEVLADVEIKQYRNNIVIKSGLVKAWNNSNTNSLTSPSGGPTKGHLRWTNADGTAAAISNPADFEVGDIITTQLQEDSTRAIGSSLFNSTPKDGWYVSNIETNKEKGSLPEFIEKEGKWFNYIKGVDFDLASPDLAALNIQGLGIVSAINNNDITIDGQLNISLQVGDTLYHQTPVTASGFTTLTSLELVGNVTAINGSDITLDAINTLAINNYCMFVKNQVINSSSLVGYYANAKFENDSITKAELFSVGSEVTESSK